LIYAVTQYMMQTCRPELYRKNRIYLCLSQSSVTMTKAA